MPLCSPPSPDHRYAATRLLSEIVWPVTEIEITAYEILAASTGPDFFKPGKGALSNVHFDIQELEGIPRFKATSTLAVKNG